MSVLSKVWEANIPSLGQEGQGWTRERRTMGDAGLPAEQTNLTLRLMRSQ